MDINLKEIEKHIRGILIALGENPDREGLKDTPKRVAQMYEEVFKGQAYTNQEIAEMFGKTFEDDLSIHEDNKDIVFMKNIEIFSHCEHHLALMYNMKVAVAYIPKDKVIGLSKIARIADLVGRRLQLQERIGTDIAEIIQMITDSDDVAVIIEGEHGCMSTRGIKKTNAQTITTTLRGRFKTDPTLQNNLMIIYK
ncbi:GTP cyclohydrolase I FolE [Tepidibacter sp. Z1-5]|uniref:GTP cyclohydrolase I FolE n=1 Tax=Tepidibacter sp. Z1-5 TaxID=3134138 RepID=UPI0030C01AA4